jgi:hypothetical protein
MADPLTLCCACQAFLNLLRSLIPAACVYLNEARRHHRIIISSIWLIRA